jgi:FkbM family methyltransferase
MRGDVSWQPGKVDQLRALVRRVLLAILGSRGEGRIHSLYHRYLRRTGRFGPPEDATTIALLSAIAHQSATIIDVGANVGRYSWFLRQHARPGSMLFAIEPHPDMARLLRRALGPIPSCTVLEVAAAEHDAIGELVVPAGAFGTPVSGLGWVQSHHENHANNSFKVRLRRLDGLIEDGAIRVVDPVFLKIDVEGGEAGVLRGAAELLRQHRPILYFECQAASLARQGETPEGVWGELRQAGYQIFGSQAGSFVPMSRADTDVVNYLGIPDLAATDDIPPLDSAAINVILDTWAARTRQEGSVRG